MIEIIKMNKTTSKVEVEETNDSMVDVLCRMITDGYEMVVEDGTLIKGDLVVTVTRVEG